MASADESPRGKPISLEELIALNDEIASLVRAGVPLETGLRDISRDAGASLGGPVARLEERLSRGQTLPQALRAEGDTFPRIYRIVVEAGLRAGRLPVALEALSGFAWELLDLRQKVGQALVYPVIVVSLAYGLFLVFILELIGRFRDTYATFQLPIGPGMQFLFDMADTAPSWVWIPPALLGAAVVWWVLVSRRHIAQLKGFPLIGTKYYRYAMFADLLAIQLDHEVSLAEGVVLAADAAGTPQMQRSARDIAEATRRGQPLSASVEERDAFPPFLRWLIVRGSGQGKLPEALKLAAGMYRRRAINRLNWFKAVFPVAAVLLIGGGVTALYALTVFLPFGSMLHGLGEATDVMPFR